MYMVCGASWTEINENLLRLRRDQKCDEIPLRISRTPKNPYSLEYCLDVCMYFRCCTLFCNNRSISTESIGKVAVKQKCHQVSTLISISTYQLAFGHIFY